MSKKTNTRRPEIRPEAWQWAIMAVNVLPWANRDDRAVLGALVHQGTPDAESDSFWVSMPAIGHALPFDLDAVALALDRLEYERQFIRTIGVTGARVDLTFRQYAFDDHALRAALRRVPPYDLYLCSDAVEAAALGHTAMFVYRAMVHHGAPLRTGQAIAAVTGVSESQAYRALQKLRDLAPDGAPLVSKTADGWIAYERSDRWLDLNVARPCGTYGKGAAYRRAMGHLTPPDYPPGRQDGEHGAQSDLFDLYDVQRTNAPVTHQDARHEAIRGEAM